MFDHYQNTKISQYRRQELQNEAEQARLAAEITSAEERPFYAPLLNNIGQNLIQLGSTLQERYGDPCADQPAPRLVPINK